MMVIALRTLLKVNEALPVSTLPSSTSKSYTDTTSSRRSLLFDTLQPELVHGHTSYMCLTWQAVCPLSPRTWQRKFDFPATNLI